MEMHLLQSFKEKNKEKSWMYLKFTENRICTLSYKWKPGEMATYFNYKLLANVTTFKFGGLYCSTNLSVNALLNLETYR